MQNLLEYQKQALWEAFVDFMKDCYSETWEMILSSETIEFHWNEFTRDFADWN